MLWDKAGRNYEVNQAALNPLIHAVSKSVRVGAVYGMWPMRCCKNVHCKRFRRFLRPRTRNTLRLSSGITTPWASSRGVCWIPTWPSCRETELPVSCSSNNWIRWEDAMSLQRVGACQQCVRTPLPLLCAKFCVLIRQGKPSKKHSAVTPTAFSHTSAFTRWPHWSTIRRKVLRTSCLWLNCCINFSVLPTSLSHWGFKHHETPVQECPVQQRQTAGVWHGCFRSAQPGCSGGSRGTEHSPLKVVCCFFFVQSKVV